MPPVSIYRAERKAVEEVAISGAQPFSFSSSFSAKNKVAGIVRTAWRSLWRLVFTVFSIGYEEE